MPRSPKQIKTLYAQLARKKKKHGKPEYKKKDFLRDIGLTRAGTFSDWEQGRSKPSLQSEMLMDVLEQRELG